MKFLIGMVVFFSFSAFAEERKVVLNCSNSMSEKITLTITKSDYDFLMFGNNSLKGKQYNISKTKRKKQITVVDNNDNNIETGFFTCTATLNSVLKSITQALL